MAKIKEEPSKEEPSNSNFNPFGIQKVTDAAESSHHASGTLALIEASTALSSPSFEPLTGHVYQFVSNHLQEESLNEKYVPESRSNAEVELEMSLSDLNVNKTELSEMTQLQDPISIHEPEKAVTVADEFDVEDGEIVENIDDGFIAPAGNSNETNGEQKVQESADVIPMNHLNIDPDRWSVLDWSFEPGPEPFALKQSQHENQNNHSNIHPDRFSMMNGKGSTFQPETTFTNYSPFHRSISPQPLNPRQSYLKENIVCFKCKEEGHWAKECTHDTGCFICKEMGHWSR